MMNHFTGLLFGIILGISSHGLYLNLRYTNFAVPAYAVGDCLSNGLFYEKVVEIRKPKNGFSEALYVTDSYINGKLSRPLTIETWIADKNYVKINPANCQVQHAD